MSRPDAHRRAATALLAVAVAVLAPACRQDMHDAPRIDPLEANAFFEHGQSARPLPAGTVARGLLREDSARYQGKDEAGAFIDGLPPALPLDRALLARGRQRYEIFCSPCHDSTGDGTGMIVRRGYQQPESYHTARLRAMPVGYFFDVVSNGFGVMPSYASQIPPDDRWAIAAYVRALQLSQGASLDELPATAGAAVRRAIAAGPAHGDGHGDDGHGDSHGGEGHGDGHDGDAHGGRGVPLGDAVEPGYGMSLPVPEGEGAGEVHHGEARDDGH